MNYKNPESACPDPKVYLETLSLPQEGGFKTSIFICQKCARFHNDNQVRNVLGSQGERILMYYKNNTNSR